VQYLEVQEYNSKSQVGYASSFYVYEQAYGADAKPLDGVLLTETKMESLTNKINTVFIKPADVFYGSIQA
jgi:iron complex outermembrane receptor protein